MREQQNPSTPELHQPLLFAPSELLACGLSRRASQSRSTANARRTACYPGAREPYDGVGAAPGPSGHARPTGAGSMRPRLRLRHGTGSSNSRMLFAAGYCKLPRPNVAAQRADVWACCIWAGTCEHPCNAARRRDCGHSRRFGRIAGHLRALCCRSDRGYAGASTGISKPVHGDWTTGRLSGPQGWLRRGRCWRVGLAPGSLANGQRVRPTWASAPERTWYLFAARCKRGETGRFR